MRDKESLGEPEPSIEALAAFLNTHRAGAGPGAAATNARFDQAAGLLRTLETTQLELLAAGEALIEVNQQWNERFEVTVAGLEALQRDTAALLAKRGVASDDARDAARWRAVLGSARIRLLGSAGLRSDTRPDGGPWNGYAHIGLELWTQHEAGHEPDCAPEWLTKYADAGIATAGQSTEDGGHGETTGVDQALGRMELRGDSHPPGFHADLDAIRNALEASRAELADLASGKLRAELAERRAKARIAELEALVRSGRDKG